MDDSDSEDEHLSSAVVESSSSTVVKEIRWTVDSGTTVLMTPKASMLLPKSLQPSSSSIRLANGSRINATQLGFSPIFNSGRGHPALLSPSLQDPLLSISAVCDDGLVELFTKT